ncbi:MAG: response regulator transcription factor, partial [Chthoniobacterales bacterium]
MSGVDSEQVTAVKTSPSSSSEVITLMIVDDHPVVREGLAAILKSQKDMKIVAEAGDGEEACKLYDEFSPDVVLLDLRMP